MWLMSAIAITSCAESSPPTSHGDSQLSCANNADCETQTEATLCGTDGYCVSPQQQSEDSKQDPPANRDAGRVDAGGDAGSKESCGDRSLDDCEDNADCKLRRLRPIDEERVCLLAPAPGHCVEADIACPDGPVVCLRDPQDKAWWGTRCHEDWHWATPGDACHGTPDGGIGAVPDCPEVVEDLEDECA